MVPTFPKKIYKKLQFFGKRASKLQEKNGAKLRIRWLKISNPNFKFSKNSFKFTPKCLKISNKKFKFSKKLQNYTKMGQKFE